MRVSAASILGAGLALLWSATLIGASTVPEVKIESATGTCQIRSADSAKWAELEEGLIPNKGDSLLTGPDSSMVISMGSVCRIRLESLTQVVLGEVMIGGVDAKAPVGIDITLESGVLLVATGKPESGAMEVLITTPTAGVKIENTASLVLEDQGAGECTLRVGDGEVQFWSVKFPDRVSRVGALSVGSMRQDAPDGVIRGMSVAERTELDRLEPLKKEISPAWAAAEATAKKKDEGGQKEIRMPQGHYALLLARAMDLEKQVLGHTNYPAISNLGSPRDVSALGGLEFTANLDDYLDALASRGIEPLDGWNRDALLTKGVMAVVLVRAYGLGDEIEKERRGDELAYMELLSDMGIVIEGTPDQLVDKIIIVTILSDPILVPVLGESFFEGPSPIRPPRCRVLSGDMDDW